MRYRLTRVKQSGEVELLRCLTIDSPTKQFLVSEIGIPTHNSDEEKEKAALKAEARGIVGSIAALGRAAWVFLVLASQRLDAAWLGGDNRDNFSARIGCSKLKESASKMLFESSNGVYTPSFPKGRLRIELFGNGYVGQGLYTNLEEVKGWAHERGFDKLDISLGEEQEVYDQYSNDGKVDPHWEGGEEGGLEELIASYHNEAANYNGSATYKGSTGEPSLEDEADDEFNF